MREEGQEATQPTGYTVTSRTLHFTLCVASVWEGGDSMCSPGRVGRSRRLSLSLLGFHVRAPPWCFGNEG